MVRVMTMKMRTWVIALTLLAWAQVQAGGRQASYEELHFIAPLSGTEVSNPIWVRVGGKAADQGRLCLLIDLQRVPEENARLGDDASCRLFPDGSQEMYIELSTGSHTLRLMRGEQDRAGKSPLLTRPVTVMVR